MSAANKETHAMDGRRQATRYFQSPAPMQEAWALGAIYLPMMVGSLLKNGRGRNVEFALDNEVRDQS